MCIKIVVDHVHSKPGVVVREAGRTLNCAWEGPINRIERRFPYVDEFVEDVGDTGLVGLVVHEDYDPGGAEDHAAQLGPVSERHRVLGRSIHEWQQSGLFNRSGEVAHGAVVPVPDENGDDIVGVSADPPRNGGEIGDHGSGIEDVTR